MKTAVITGASGVVGRRVLHHLLARPDVVRVVALGRRHVGVSHPKLVEHVLDLTDENAVLAAMPEGADVAFCCLGTTMKQAGSQAAFRKVDYDAVLAFGKAARSQGIGHFALVSSVGADAASRAFYLRVKGEAESALAALGWQHLTLARPASIDDEGARTDQRLGEQLSLPVLRAVFSIAGKSSRYAPIKADTIARALIRLALDEANRPAVDVVQSEALQVLGA